MVSYRCEIRVTTARPGGSIKGEDPSLCAILIRLQEQPRTKTLKICNHRYTNTVEAIHFKYPRALYDQAQ